jgi:hypothetical protein
MSDRTQSDRAYDLFLRVRWQAPPRLEGVAGDLAGTCRGR